MKRLKGEEKIDYPHAHLKAALKDTLGIPIYQEQILQMAHDFAHFSLSDGDMLRRVMTKERNQCRMRELENLFFTKASSLGYEKKEIDKISLISPHAKVNIIKNYEVVEKREVEIPDIISDVLLCSNPDCISNHEEIKTKFYIISRNPLTLRCHYCERVASELKFK